jgi:hypothetical protein
MQIMDDCDAGFQKGAKHGFNKALFAVRNVDKQLEYPEKGSKQDHIIYNAQKDMIYKIYEEIKFEMTKEVEKNGYNR